MFMEDFDLKMKIGFIAAICGVIAMLILHLCGLNSWQMPVGGFATQFVVANVLYKRMKK